MKNLSNIIAESLLDDENELINSGDLSPIKLTGIPGVDNTINEINGKINSPQVYNYVEKLIEISKKISTEFDLNNILPRNIIKNINELATTNLKSQTNVLKYIDDINAVRCASDFINSMIKSAKLKYFTNSNIFKKDTYLDSTGRRGSDTGYVLTWVFYDNDKEKFDIDVLESDMKQIKTKTKLSFEKRNAGNVKILKVYFF